MNLTNTMWTENMLFLHKVQKQAKLEYDVKVKILVTLDSVYN